MATDQFTRQQYIDKRDWPDGPWKSEPDLIYGSVPGASIKLNRDGSVGHWRGSVGVPVGSPLHWFSPHRVPPQTPDRGPIFHEFASHEARADFLTKGVLTLAAYLDVHGGVRCALRDGPLWWFCFHCGGHRDELPLVDAGAGDVYRTAEFALREAKYLAAQLVAWPRLSTVRIGRETK